ncbi:MAG: hypothetical protein KGL39_20745 [Patescibacteria group bacterium]|nr:hypothetical protein [Patescibacteria group bacterium]
MSAYVVDAETIDRIVTYIEMTLDRNRPSMRPDLYRAAQAANPTQLGAAMLAMNVAAVDDRYQESNPTPIYTHTWRSASAVQVYKSLRCYLYQCTEGEVPTRPLYHLLLELQSELADGIISNLPEYTKAAWG